MSRLIPLLIGGAALAAAAKLLDRRRGAKIAGRIKQAANAVTPGGGLKDPDDVTLARKVETAIFRPADAPKGDVSVDVQAGVVHLRGAVADDAWIERLAEGAREVDGVKGVKNLLHRPGTPAPQPQPRAAIEDRQA
jgi:osmotically-inducible protein OsmY